MGLVIFTAICEFPIRIDKSESLNPKFETTRKLEKEIGRPLDAVGLDNSFSYFDIVSDFGFLISDFPSRENIDGS